MELQMELTRRGIPFEITSGLRFFEQAHVKDVAAFLKFVVNPRDEVAFKRMVRLLPGIGARSAEQLWEQTTAALDRLPATVAALAQKGENGESVARVADFRALLAPLPVPAKAQKSWMQLAHTLDEMAPRGEPSPPAEMIASVREAIYDDYAKAEFANYDQRREDLNTLMTFARQYEKAADFLDQLALLTSLDHEVTATRDETELVTLSSVHQSKGLEWKVVFVIWMSDGMFPSSRSLESDDAIEEERRLFYVAVTRAKDELYLSYPHLRLGAGYGEMLQRPSRFLMEIPPELVEEWNVSRRY
jgi:DNA helicase-2/ATP-dependent DNA helicase PcrA